MKCGISKDGRMRLLFIERSVPGMFPGDRLFTHFNNGVESTGDTVDSMAR